jgi:Ni,Fe-hydrogenase I cytochrome b subunit
MAQYEPEPQVSGWAVGGIAFAGTIMIMLGIFHAIDGIAAIADDEFYVVTQNYVFDLDVTVWGWIHLILGIILAVTGYFLLARRPWAGVVAITLAVISACIYFFYIPYQPWWSLLIIALNVFVIWAITRPYAMRT